MARRQTTSKPEALPPDPPQKISASPAAGFSAGAVEKAVPGSPGTVPRPLLMDKNPEDGVPWSMPEAMVADRMGLAREKLREWRQGSMVKEVDFQKAGRDVIWLEGALRKCAAAMHADLEGLRKGLGVVKAEVLAAVVDNVPTNRKIVVAVLKNSAPSSPIKVRVRVNDNLNFVRGMDLAISPESNEGPMDDRMFVLVGRVPRQRGRW